MGMISRAIATFRPKANYEGAQRSRRLQSWRTTDSNINSLLRAEGDELRRRSRHLCRNNPYACNAIEAFVGAAVGTGIKPSSLVQDADLKTRVQRAWLAWTDEADADGLTDFYGLQALATRAMFEAGECFVRFRPRRAEDGLSVPLQMQLLESEMLPLAKNDTLSGGAVIRSGIEFDAIGRRVAYHFFRSHPGDVIGSAGETVRVPASEVLHLYRPVRPGQIRGEPWIKSAVAKLYLLDQYDDAELDRKKVAALFAGFFTKPAEADGLPTATDDDGAAILGLQPGTMQELPEGWDVRFSEPADVGGSYESFQYRTLTAVAAAMGVPYAAMTGDLRQVNYSSIRAGLVEFRRRIEVFQHAVLVFQFCRPVWQRWIDAAALSGAFGYVTKPSVEELQTAVKWVPQGWPWVDPLKDRQAEAFAVANGFKSRSDVIEAEGYDAEEIDARIAADREREAGLGLTFTAVPAAPTNGDADE